MGDFYSRSGLGPRSVYVRLDRLHLPKYRALAQNTMYSILDCLLAPTRVYTAHPSVYVISDSKYKDVQDNQETELFAHLENVRADLLNQSTR